MKRRRAPAYAALEYGTLYLYVPAVLSPMCCLTSCFTFVMVALCNRADHYIFMLWFVVVLLSFFSSPNLSSRRLDVYHTSAHGVVLV